MPEKLYVDIVLDKPRRLRFDLNALADMEEKSGRGVQDIFGGGGAQLGLAALRLLLWAGLKWDDRRITLERAGEILQEYMSRGDDLAALAGHIEKALKASGIIRDASEEKTAGEAAAPATVS